MFVSTTDVTSSLTQLLPLQLDEIQRNNEYLKKENATLESYLHRHVTVSCISLSELPTPLLAEQT